MKTMILTIMEDGSCVGHVMIEGSIDRTAIGDTIHDVIQLLDQ